MTQTIALFYDAYRRLKDRKLFYVVLILSALVALAMGSIGINERGVRIITWDLSIPGFNTQVMTPAAFYKTLFMNFGLGLWLTWVATALALFSTAGVFPDFLTSGGIDLVLAKPIGRVRLFFTKYAAALTFVAIQVFVFTLMSFLIIGIRGGEWEGWLFLTVPLVLLFYSFLYCVCVLFGVLTRSTVSALLLTIMLWTLIGIVNWSDAGSLKIATELRRDVESRQRIAAALDERIAQMQQQLDAGDDSVQQRLEQFQKRRQKYNDSDKQEATLATAQTVNNIVYRIKTFLPKTSETVDLLERVLSEQADLPKPMDEQVVFNDDDDIDYRQQRQVVHETAKQDMIREFRSRSVVWVLGTSLLFEAVVLAIACWVFCRKDF